MTKKNILKHNAEIIEQFTQQAIPFTRLPGHLNAIEMIIDFSGVTESDTVLDVACGPGLVACEFAKIAGQVTGIDITEKMIEQAKMRQRNKGLNNISWDVGTACPLPYESDSFSIVVSRYSFHHFLNPQAVLHEMIRVCKPDGIVLIADAALPDNKVDAYNQMEKLRDPSHTKALSYSQWEQLMRQSGLKNLKCCKYKVDMELEAQISASFPKPGDDVKLRELFKNDLGTDSLGMDVHLYKGQIHFSYPISIYAGNKV